MVDGVGGQFVEQPVQDGLIRLEGDMARQFVEKTYQLAVLLIDQELCVNRGAERLNSPDKLIKLVGLGHQLRALSEGIAPPTIGLEEEDEVCRLNYVKGKAQPLDCDYALSNSFGFGGHNSCLVLKKQPKGGILL